MLLNRVQFKCCFLNGKLSRIIISLNDFKHLLFSLILKIHTSYTLMVKCQYQVGFVMSLHFCLLLQLS